MASLSMHVCGCASVYLSVRTCMHVHVTIGLGTVPSPQFRLLALLHFVLTQVRVALGPCCC